MKRKPKPFKSFEEQVEILIKRKLIVEDKESAKEQLSRTSYYRVVNAYGEEFYDKDQKSFKKNTTLEQIFQIYEFDRALRQLLFGYLEKIEVLIRTQISYFLAKEYGSLCYLEKKIYSKKFKFEEFINKLEKERELQKNNDIVKHYKTEYEEMPIWVMAECMTFGTLSLMFSFINREDQEKIVENILGYPANGFHFSKCIHALVKVRNICAHYGRLYNKKIHEGEIKSEFLFQEEITKSGRLFPILLVAIRLLTKEDAEKLHSGVVSIIESYPLVDVFKLGFPYYWTDVMNKEIQAK